MSQASLDFTQPVASERPAAQTPAERFAAFHEANPQVYAELRDLALRAKGVGLRRYGMKGLFEVLRWNRALQTQGEPWLLNNTFTPFYARLLMQQEAELRDFFELRSSMAGSAVHPPEQDPEA